MAIAFDASTNGGEVTATSLTVSHTCTGANLILFVGVLTGGGDIVTGVTYNSVAMTQVNKRDCGSNNWIYLYYLINPATGAHNVVASQSASAFIDVSAASYTGAGQIDTNTTNGNASATSLTTSVTTVADNCWTVMTVRASSNGVISAGAGTTLRVGSSFNCLLDSNAAKTPSGSTSLIFTTSPAQGMHAVMASFAPFVPAGGGFFAFF